MEGDYPLIIEKILRKRGRTTPIESYRLMMSMIDFNLRNIAYENRTERERKDVYTKISGVMVADIFAEAEGRGTDFEGMMAWLKINWGVRAIRIESEEKFITSDNPATIFSTVKVDSPVLIYMPVHPKIAVIAFDKRYLRFASTKASNDAVGVLNGLQVTRCVEHVFSDYDLFNDKDRDQRHSQ